VPSVVERRSKERPWSKSAAKSARKAAVAGSDSEWSEF
jgi:hypothetical protein